MDVIPATTQINVPVRTRALLKEIFLPESLSGVMSRVLGSLSILALITHPYRFGLSKSLHAFIQQYEKTIKVLLGWAEPYLASVAQSISQLIDVHIRLSSSWRHVFVILFMLFVRDAGVAFSDRRYATSCVRLLTGLTVAVLSSVLATAELIKPSKLLWNFQISVVPYLGVYIYDLIMYVNSASLTKTGPKQKDSITHFLFWRSEIFRDGFIRASCRFGIVLCVITFSFCLPVVSKLAYPKGGLLVLGVATAANAAYWVYRALRHIQKIRKEDAAPIGASWMVLFKSSEAGRFALAIISVFAWSATFIVINAGFCIIGL